MRLDDKATVNKRGDIVSLNNIVSADFVPDWTDSRHKEHRQEMIQEHQGNVEFVEVWQQLAEYDGLMVCDECQDHSDVEDHDDTFYCTYCERSWDNPNYSNGSENDWGLELTPIWVIRTETGFPMGFYDTEDMLEHCRDHDLDHDEAKIGVRFVVSTGGPHDEYILSISSNGHEYDKAEHKYLPWFAGYAADVSADEESMLLDFFNRVHSVELVQGRIDEMHQEYAELRWDYTASEDDTPDREECGDSEDVEAGERFDWHCTYCDRSWNE